MECIKYISFIVWVLVGITGAVKIIKEEKKVKHE
jgi:hypothetical protein